MGNNWQLLRTKIGATADPDWSALALHPNTFIVTIGGTASDGNYVTTINPVAPGASIVITTVRAAGTPATNALIAAAHAADITTLIATTLAPYIVSAVAVGATVQVRVKHNAPPFTVQNSETTATGTIVTTPDNLWPIAASLSPNRNGPMTQVELAFIQVDAAGVQLPDNNAATVSYQLVEAWTPGSLVKVVGSAPVATHPVQQKAIAPLHGAEALGVQIDAIATTATGYVAMEIWYRETEG